MMLNLRRELRLVRRLIVLHGNQTEIARATGLSQTAISKLVREERDSCNTATLESLYNYFARRRMLPAQKKVGRGC